MLTFCNCSVLINLNTKFIEIKYALLIPSLRCSLTLFQPRRCSYKKITVLYKQEYIVRKFIKDLTDDRFLVYFKGGTVGTEKCMNRTLSWSEGMSAQTDPREAKKVVQAQVQKKKPLFTNETTAIIWGMQSRAVQVSYMERAARYLNNCSMI